MLPFATPALPLDEAGKYVAGAYVVFLILILVYVSIMAAKLQRIEKELRELAGFAETRASAGGAAAVQAAQGGQGAGASADGSGSAAEQPSVGSESSVGSHE